MTEKYSRHLNFESISNFRDIGRPQPRQGKAIAWRRIFRSGALRHATNRDFKRLKEEIRLATVIDLRSAEEIERQGIGIPAEADIKYHNIAFMTDGGNREADERRFRTFTNMGQFYLDIVRDKGFGRHIIEALEIIAGAANAMPLPTYFWKASPESMELFLNTLRKEYGSIPGYLKSMGSTDSLIENLKKALLV